MQLLPRTGERQVDPDNVAPDHRKRYELAANLLPGSKVLDAGCGVGYGSLILADAGCAVVGIDNSPEAIEYANWRCSHPSIQYMVGDIAYINQQFDAVVALEIIEHVKNPETLLHHWRQVSRALFASVPNESVLPYSKDKFPFHFRHYRPDEFRQLLHDTGWEITREWTQYDKWSGDLEPNFDGRTLVIMAR